MAQQQRPIRVTMSTANPWHNINGQSMAQMKKRLTRGTMKNVQPVAANPWHNSGQSVAQCQRLIRDTNEKPSDLWHNEKPPIHGTIAVANPWHNVDGQCVAQCQRSVRGTLSTANPWHNVNSKSVAQCQRPIRGTKTTANPGTMKTGLSWHSEKTANRGTVKKQPILAQ